MSDYDYDELAVRAVGRRRVSNYGVGAALGRDVTEGQDGREFECVITDTINRPEVIRVLLPRVERDAEVDHERVERMVEDLAGAHPIDERVSRLADARRVSLPDYWLQPAD